MSLVSEIQRVHDFLYKEVGDTKLLLPIMLTFLDKFKDKKRAGYPDPIDELKNDFRRLDRRSMEQTLQKIRREHPFLSPLFERLIDDALSAIRIDRLPDVKIDRVKNRILAAEDFLRGLENEDDFVGILFEALAAHSGVFDKQEGRFFTPKNVILIVVETVASLLDKQKKNLNELSVCDPCCGSARYLIYWVNRIKRTNALTDDDVNRIYSNHLFGIDIKPEVAGWAAWNMIFHGNGAVNIANADSLNYFGYIVHWGKIQKFIEELPSKLQEIKNKIKQESILERIRNIESDAKDAVALQGKDEIDLNSESVLALIRVLNELVSIHHDANITYWETLEELSQRKDFDSINEVIKVHWSKVNPAVKRGFDLVITNPPFGRGSQDLMVTNPYILCQYKFATELWLGDMSKEITEQLLKKQFDMPLVDFYKEVLQEMNINELKEEYEIKFKDLPSDLLKSLAIKHGVSTKGKNKQTIVEELISNLERDIVVDNELSINIASLPASFIKKLASSLLYEKEGGKAKVTEFLYEKIKEKLGGEWVTIEDVYDYAYKLTIKDSLTGDEHIIYFDENWEPLLFKKALPKQVVFLEEFLRFVKDGGYVFTVVDTGVLSNSEDEYVRRFLYKNARIHAIVEFPHNAFKAAGTGVKTAVILYQKMKNPPEDYEIFGALPQNLGYILNKQDTPPDPDHNDLGKVLCDWRNILGLGRMCEPSKRSDINEEEYCDWYKKEHCPVWRKVIEKADL